MATEHARVAIMRGSHSVPPYPGIMANKIKILLSANDSIMLEKDLLASVSKVFDGIVNGNGFEASQDIDLRFHDAKVVKTFFMQIVWVSYGNNPDLDKCDAYTITELFVLADMYDVKVLCNALIDKAIEKQKVETFLPMMAMIEKNTFRTHKWHYGKDLRKKIKESHTKEDIEYFVCNATNKTVVNVMNAILF